MAGWYAVLSVKLLRIVVDNTVRHELYEVHAVSYHSQLGLYCSRVCCALSTGCIQSFIHSFISITGVPYCMLWKEKRLII